MFAVHYCEKGEDDFVGEVFSESTSKVKIQAADALSLVCCGFWVLSDEIKEFDKLECRFFLTEEDAMRACKLDW